MLKPANPTIGANAYIAETAYVAGHVTLGDDVTVMHHVVIRGDVAPIAIGHRVNIQDGTVVHTRTDVPLDIGSDVAIGHRAVVHGESVGPRTLIGIGAIVLDNARIGERCLIAAGAVVAPGTVIPDRSLVMGLPARVVRPTTDEDVQMIDEIVAGYVELGRAHAAGAFPNIAGANPNLSV